MEQTETRTDHYKLMQWILWERCESGTVEVPRMDIQGGCDQEQASRKSQQHVGPGTGGTRSDRGNHDSHLDNGAALGDSLHPDVPDGEGWCVKSLGRVHEEMKGHLCREMPSN